MTRCGVRILVMWRLAYPQFNPVKFLTRNMPFKIIKDANSFHYVYNQQAIMISRNCYTVTYQSHYDRLILQMDELHLFRYSPILTDGACSIIHHTIRHKVTSGLTIFDFFPDILRMCRYYGSW